MTFEQFYRILLARRKIALSLFLGFIALAIGLSQLLPKSYVAKTSIMVDLKADPVSGVTQLATMQPTAYLATQVNIIKSDAVARRVVDKLRLNGSSEMMAKWEKETKRRGDFNDWLGKVLLKGLDVSMVKESSIIEIEYDSVDPAFAAGLANAFAQSYIETLVQLRTAPSQRYTEYFEERAAMARKKLEAAQAKLVEAQRDKGILLNDERFDTEVGRLNEMGSQAVALRALLSDSANRNIAANRRSDQTQEVLSSTVVASLKSDLSRQNASLNELLAQKGDNHPSVLQLRASISETERRLANETARVSGSVGVTETIIRAREAAAQQAYEEQREKLLKMKEERRGISMLEREVESAQRIYEALQLRLSQNSLESNSSQSPASVLAYAVEPPKHASPNLFVYLLVGIFGGGILALLVTLCAELLDRRVRTSVDLLQALELPVIGVLPSPNAPKLRWFRRKSIGHQHLLTSA